jgi:hypothetical protein
MDPKPVQRNRNNSSNTLATTQEAAPSAPEGNPDNVNNETKIVHTAYINGYADGFFRPEQTTTRAELAAMLWRILQSQGEKAVSQSTTTYSDVPNSHWAHEAIEGLHAKGIMLGVGEGQFQPDRYLTRAEFAVLAVRWKQLKPGETHIFKDIVGHWAENEIKALSNSGIAAGYDGGLFRPNSGVTRAEMVKMINRLMNRGPLTGIDQPSWKDVSVSHWAFGDIEEASLTHNAEILPNGDEQFGTQ